MIFLELWLRESIQTEQIIPLFVFKKYRLNPSDIFNNEFKEKGLKQTAVKGSVALGISQGMSFGLSLTNTIVLARLLTPADFGIIGMVTVFINFLIMFKDAGLSTATIQREEINRQQISTLFWINSFISLFLGIVIASSSPLIAAFYKKPELTTVTIVLSLSFILQGLTIQHSALLQRHLKFSVLATIDIIGHIVYTLIAIIMAILGFRYWALIGGTMGRTLIIFIFTFYACPWVPGSLRRGTGVRGMLRFGGHLTSSYFIGYLARNLDRILIGRMIGAASLGLYTRAFTLLMQPLTQIRAPLTKLSLPVLSSLKNDPERYRSYFGKILDVSISLALPISVYCFLESEFLIGLLLGEKWMDAVPVFRILSVGGVFVATSGAPGVVMQSHGYSKRYLKLSVVNASIITLSFIVGAFFGLIGVATAYSTSSFLIMIPLVYFGFRGTPITMKLILESIAGPLASALAAGVTTYFFIHFYSQENLIKHIIAGLIFFIIYTGVTLLRPKTRDTLLSVRESLFSRT